jgi:hypothetical protein
VSNGVLTYRELIKRLKPYGVEVRVNRGKGSERILLLPETPGGSKGPQYPIKYHGDNTRVGRGALAAVLRRFNIDPKDYFWR